MDTSIWTDPPISESPGDLRPVLLDARLINLRWDACERCVSLSFALPEGAGPLVAEFEVHAVTHLFAFAYLPPALPPPSGEGPEAAVAAIGDWARQGLVTGFDPFSPATELVAQIAKLHRGEAWATLELEGYGEDPDRIVWWRIVVSGSSVEAVGDQGKP